MTVRIEVATDQSHTGDSSLKVIANSGGTTELKIRSHDPADGGEVGDAWIVDGLVGDLALTAWAYANDPTVTEFVVTWKFYAEDGTTLITTVTSDTVANDPGNWIEVPCDRSVVPEQAHFLYGEAVAHLESPVGVDEAAVYWDDFGYTVLDPPAGFTPHHESGDFEDGTTGLWVQNAYPEISQVTVENSTDRAHRGSHSLKAVLWEEYPYVIVLSASPTNSSHDGLDHFVPIAEDLPSNIPMVAYAWTDCPEITEFHVEWYFFDSEDNPVASSNAQAPAVMGEWVRIAGTATSVPDTAVWLEGRLYAYLSFASEARIGVTTVYWDDLSYGRQLPPPVPIDQVVITIVIHGTVDDSAVWDYTVDPAVVGGVSVQTFVLNPLDDHLLGIAVVDETTCTVTDYTGYGFTLEVVAGILGIPDLAYGDLIEVIEGSYVRTYLNSVDITVGDPP